MNINRKPPGDFGSRGVREGHDAIDALYLDDIDELYVGSDVCPRLF